MNLSQKHRELIEEIIKKNSNYTGHEDLMEQFCSEVYKKSYLLLDSVSNLDSLKNYLTKVADSSILNVIQNVQKNPPQKNQLQKKPRIDEIMPVSFEEKEDTLDLINYLPDIKQTDIKPPSIEKSPENKVVSLRDSIKKEYSTQRYNSLIDPQEFFPKVVMDRAYAMKVTDAIKKIHSREPNKKFAQIFKMRHIQSLRQGVIARKLKLSQADLSKRYCELIKLMQDAMV